MGWPRLESGFRLNRYDTDRMRDLEEVIAVEFFQGGFSEASAAYHKVLSKRLAN
jgi:hypothetical protein